MDTHPRTSFEKSLQAAEKHLSRGRHRKALEIYLRLLGESPDDPRLLRRVADLGLATGARAEATSALKKLVERYEEDGFADKAIAVNKRLIRLDPEDLKLRYELGLRYAEHGKKQESVAEISRVGRELEAAGSPGVIEVYRRLIEIDPDRLEHRARLAGIYWRFRLYKKAVEMLRQIRTKWWTPRARWIELYLEVGGADLADRRSVIALAANLVWAGDRRGATELLAFLKDREADARATPAVDQGAFPAQPSTALAADPVPA